MVFVVETGEGLATANSYLAVADADAYFTDHSAPAGWTGSSAVKENALRMATQYLDARYKLCWKGMRRLETQALDWPRFSAEDRDGYYIDFDNLPAKLEEACAELALRHLTETGGLFPDLSAPSGGVVSQRDKVGPVETETRWSGTSSPYKRYSIVEALLADLLRPSGKMVRA